MFRDAATRPSSSQLTRHPQPAAPDYAVGFRCLTGQNARRPKLVTRTESAIDGTGHRSNIFEAVRTADIGLSVSRSLGRYVAREDDCAWQSEKPLDAGLEASRGAGLPDDDATRAGVGRTGSGGHGLSVTRGVARLVGSRPTIRLWDRRRRKRVCRRLQGARERPRAGRATYATAGIGWPTRRRS
jgi:hypothetical protein